MLETSQTVVIDDYAFIPNFQTEGSFSLVVVRNSGEVDIRNEKGWVDLHQIREPVPSVAIRGSLPSECLRFEFLNRLLSAIFSQLQISETISRDVRFFRTTECIDMSRSGNAIDDDQTTDRISTSRSFRFPRGE